MKIALGCDHGGYIAKEALKKYLESLNIEVIDCGCFSSASCNYPVFAFKAAEEVANKQADKGVLICNSGEGVCICANKVNGIICGIGYNDDVSHLIVEHNHANMIAFGAQFTTIESIIKRTEIFLNSKPLLERHLERVCLIKEYEKSSI